VEDIAGIGDLLSGGIIEFALDFIIDSFKNTLGALMWPVEIVTFAPPWGAIGFGLAFVAFPKYLKKPIEGWLFDEEPAADKDPTADEPKK